MGIAKLGKQIKEHKIFVIIPIVILIIVVLARTFIWRDYTKEQIEMAKYLKDKYNGQEFVVEKPELKGAMLGIEGYFSATAYPANNSKIRFTVMYSPSDRYDGYAGAIWSNEESERLKPEIYRLFGKGTDYTVEIKSAMTLQTAKIDMDIRGKIPNFNDAVKKYGKQIPYGLTIKRLKKNLSDDEKEDIVNKLIEISTLLPDETDNTITYISEASEKREYGLIEPPDDLRKLNSREDKVKKFREWEMGL
jgi:hypothetical protein